MTIDERLDRLTDRHEALTQSIELMHHDWQEKSGQITRNFETITRTFETVLDSIKRLEHIAAAHEERIDRLEG
jgi:hypothetical protein